MTLMHFFNINHYDTNFLSRVRNVIVTAFNQHDKVPKAIVMILDFDFMRYLLHGSAICISFEAGKLIEWLIREVNKVTITRLDQLPQKSKWKDQPHVIWFGLPTQNYLTDDENNGRMKFNKCFENILPLYPNMSLLLPKKGWDIESMDFISNGTFTHVGLTKYWEAIDAAIHFWDSKNKGQIIQ